MIEGTITQRQATTESYEHYDKTLKQELGLAGTDCGLHTLNMITGGHVGTNITTIGGRSGSGKSSLMIPMCDAAARVLNNRRSELLVASWEMKAAKLVDRYVCYKTGLNLMQLKYPKILLADQRAAIVRAYKDASALPIHYHQYSSDITVVSKMLIEFATKVKKKEDVEGRMIQPVFVLDYIGRAKGTSKYSNRTYDLQGFLYGIKEVCNQTGMSAVILAQINRGADQRDQPEVYDLSDSSSIEQASDNVILLDRPEMRQIDTIKYLGGELPSQGKALMRVVKARETAAGDVVVKCDMSTFRWADLGHSYDYEYWKDYSNEQFWRSHFRM
jgi:replicative DNA helicase